jgi:Pectate lyase superfamily protein
LQVNRRLFILLFFSAVLTNIAKQKAVLSAETRPIINVKNYGAVGDGLADDTLAIQKVIDRGYSVYFPTGIYKVNGLNLHSNCVYYGAGDKSVIELVQKVYQSSQITNYQSNSALNLNNLENVKIRQLKFICPESKIKKNPAIEYANIAINVNSSKNCQIEFVTIENFSGIAILCSGLSDKERCTNILINKVKVRNWYDAYEGSFPQIWFFKYVHNSTVKNSSLEGGTFGIGFYDAYHGTKVDGVGENIPGAGVYRCAALNNTIKNQSRYGIVLYCTRSISFPKELVEHLVKGNTISNIRGSSHVKDKAFGAGIYAVGVTGLIISNNTVSNCNQITTAAMLAPGCIGIVKCYGNILIDSNTCYEGKWSNLYISNVNWDRPGHLVVKNNTLKNSIKENLFCTDVDNGLFVNNKISSNNTAKLAPVSFRSVKNIVFRDNVIFFNAQVNQDALFVFQSDKLKIINNQITTLNPVSINRLQEVSNSIISGNTYNSANYPEQETIQFVNSRNNKFIRNTINKPSGGKKVMSYEK